MRRAPITLGSADKRNRAHSAGVRLRQVYAELAGGVGAGHKFERCALFRKRRGLGARFGLKLSSDMLKHPQLGR